MSAPITLLAPAPLSVGPRNSRGAGGLWFSGRGGPPESARSRLGLGGYGHPIAALGMSQHRVDRNLLPVQYWQLYKTSPDVRACVDSIVRRIATWNWSFEVQTDPRDAAEYRRLRGRADAGQRWLAVPNANGETWQELMTRTGTDLLLYDAGAWELNVPGADLAEIVPWLGSEWLPIYDERSMLLRYEQHKEGGAASGAKLMPERMVYFSLFRNNRGPLGMPLLDTLVDECVTVLLASEHAMLALDANEIPPGLLVVGGVAGAAAERARADLQQMRGRDHKLRVITSPQPAGIRADWVELRHTPKDLSMIEVVDNMRRTIWRTFGVMPVELGVFEGVPRASATVQVDVSSSHLITPILELVQARINAQIVPLMFGSDAASIAFRFDRDQPLTPDQRLSLAKAQDVRVRRGIITVNEARADLGLLPVPGGDVAVMDTNEGPRPLTDIAAGSPAPADSGGAADGGRKSPERGSGSLRPLTAADRAQLVQLRAQLSRAARGSGLPSDWPDAGRWDPYRVIDVRALGDAVADYTRGIAGLYADTVADLQVLLAQGYGGDDRLSPAEADSTLERMFSRLDDFAAGWSALSAPLYARAAQLAADSADTIAGGVTQIDPAARAESYHERAMSYLTDPDGLIGTLRTECRRTVSALTIGERSAAPADSAGCCVADSTRDRIDDLTPDAAPERALSTLELSLTAQAHRIDNWSGRMVGLANSVLVDALNQTASQQDGSPVEWWCEWVNAGGKTCPICRDEGSQGFRAISQLSRRPGEDTFCVGRCRCVLVFWTKREIDAGAAIKLSELAPGGPDA